MTVSVADVQNAIKDGLASLGATAPGALVWVDEQRPAAKVIVTLRVVTWNEDTDREEYSEDPDSPGQLLWRLSTLHNIRIQVQAESIYNAPETNALFTLEKIRAGLRRPDLVFAAGVVNQPDVNTYVHRVSFPHNGHIISAYSFETNFRAVTDYALAPGTVPAGTNMQQVQVIGEDADPAASNQIINRPVAGSAPLAPIGARLDVADAADGSSVPDGLNTNPAVQSVVGRRPTKGVSESGAAMLSFDGSDALVWPLTSENAANTAWGLALWLRPHTSGADGVVYSVSEYSASGWRIYAVRKAGGEFSIAVNSLGVDGSGRAGQTDTADLVINEWHFVTLEYDSTGVTDADKLVVTVDSATRAMSFGAVGDGDAIGVLPVVTGDAILGDIMGASSIVPFQGDIGAHVWVLNAKDPDATEGLLTPAQRAALMAVDPPE